MNDKIRAILDERQQQSTPGQITDQPPDDQFYQIYRGDSSDLGFLEFRFRGGIQSAFSYGNLNWINLDNAGGMIDMDFMGFAVSIEGRGLKKVFEYIKLKKLSWVCEADTDFQDQTGIETFIKDISIEPPEDFGTTE